jgi:putative ABC transport system permease protein
VVNGTILGGNVLGGSNQSGETVTVTGVPGTPTLTVVGFADSVTSTASGWVLPTEISKLVPPGTPSTAQMLYRFRSAATDSAVSANVAVLRKTLPAGSILGAESYLAVKQRESERVALFVPFVVAFGVIGLILSVLIVANVVSGAVVADYTRIGILKSIGFTPAQVAGTYVSQALAPAAVGCCVGAVLGDLLAVKLVLGRAAIAFGVGELRVPVLVVIGVPATLWLLTGIVALIPARRAGRLSAIQAIAAGRAPRSGHGYAAHRLAARLALPRPVSLGLAAPFARPVRTVMTLAAVLLGATAVTFAYGLGASLNDIAHWLNLEVTEQVQVLPPVPNKNGANPQFSPAQEHAVDTALRSTPGAQHYVAQIDMQASVAGLSQPVALTAFDGDASWIEYPVVTGHWYTGPGQAVVPLGFLNQTGTAVGDTVTVTVDGRQLPIRIVGQVFLTEDRGLAMLTDSRTFVPAGQLLLPDRYDVELRPDTGASAYAQALSTRLGQAYAVMLNDPRSTLLIAMEGLVSLLTLLIAIAAGLGVLNTVIVQTREKAHDLGIFKAVGMTPWQAITMVVCWTAGTGLVAGIIAVPIGIGLHRYVLPAMAASVNTGLPAFFLNVYAGPVVVALALAGLLIAVAGALAPASWAAGTRTATALRAE